MKPVLAAEPGLSAECQVGTIAQNGYSDSGCTCSACYQGSKLKLLKIAKKMEAKVRCLYVKTGNSDVSEETIKHWETEFAGEPVKFSVIPNDDVKETILDFVLFKDIDMLAMLTYKRNFFVELFKPSLTQKIANQSSIPILAVHE